MTKSDRKILTIFNILMWSFLSFILFMFISVTQVDAAQILPNSIYFDGVKHNFSTSNFEPDVDNTYINLVFDEKLQGTFNSRVVINYYVANLQSNPWKASHFNGYVYIGSDRYTMTKSCNYEPVGSTDSISHIVCQYDNTSSVNYPTTYFIQLTHPSYTFNVSDTHFSLSARIFLTDYTETPPTGGDTGNTGDNTDTILNNQNQNTDSIINNNNTNKNEIINNQEQNKQDIIDNQNKNQQETNDKLDEAEETRKGILGFIQNIWDGIVHLPENIWNLLKGGFEMIGGFISNMLDAIKGIFLPEPICTESPNIFEYNTSMAQVWGVKFTLNPDDKSITINGTSTSRVRQYASKQVTLEPGDYVASFFADKEGIFVEDTSSTPTNLNMLFYSSGMYYIFYNVKGTPTMTIDETLTGYFIFDYGSGTTFDNVTIYPYVQKGTELPSEYMYYGQKICEETSFWTWFERLGNMIGNFFTTLLNGILDGLKALFIPTEKDLNDIIDKSTEISENFGFVGESFAFVIRLFTSIAGMINQDGCLMLPALDLRFGGILGLDNYKIWEDTNVCMSENAWFGNNTEAIDIVRTLTTGSLVCGFISFAISQFNQILSKEDTEI